VRQHATAAAAGLHLHDASGETATRRHHLPRPRGGETRPGMLTPPLGQLHGVPGHRVLHGIEAVLEVLLLGAIWGATRFSYGFARLGSFTPRTLKSAAGGGQRGGYRGLGEGLSRHAGLAQPALSPVLRWLGGPGGCPASYAGRPDRRRGAARSDGPSPVAPCSGAGRKSSRCSHGARRGTRARACPV